jgi:hypothetical protein
MTGAPPVFQSMFSEGPQGPPRRQGPLFPSLAEGMLTMGTEMAQGWGEEIGYQVAAGAKAAADSITHIGTLAAKSLVGVESMIGGGTFDEGYEAARQQMKMDIGTTDPGAMEVIESLARKMGLASSEGPSVGKQTDDLIQRRLGNSAVVGQTVGSLLSFVAGPGAAVGRAGAQTAKPLANWMERMLVRNKASKIGVGREAIDAAISQGRGWEALSLMPKWQQTAGIIDRTMAAVGRSNMQLMETMAANIAQSYAMAPDDQRLQGAIAATRMSPFMMPIARTSEMLASRIAGLRMSGAQAATIREAFDAAESGKISLPELDTVIRSNSSRSMRGLANGIAGAAEGTVFMSMDPSAWNELKLAQAGDGDAAARLLGMWAGTAVGVVATKGLLPQDLAPMFRTVRPDANTLSTYIDAERNKRLAQQEPEKPQPPREPSKADGIYSGQDQPVQLPGAMRSPDAQPPKKGKGKLAPGDPTQDITRPPEDRSDVRLFGGVDADSPAYREQKAQEEWRAYDRQMRSTYGWAQTYADGPLRAGFTPTFEEGGNVRLNHGRDFSVTLVKEQNPNIDWSVGMTLRMDPKVGAELRDYGRPLPDYKLDPAGRFVEISGQDAVKALNDLTMLGAYRQLEGALQYQRAGFTEVEPGVWRSDDGIYHTRQLDGSTATKGEFDGDKWTATADFVFLGDFGQPVYDGPTLQALEQWVVRKAALAPDPLVDGILGHAASIARYGNGIGAQGLRQWLDATTDIQWRLNPTYDRQLAMTLAELASGNNNAQHAAKEAPRRMAPPAASPEVASQPEQPDAPKNPSWSPYGAATEPYFQPAAPEQPAPSAAPAAQPTPAPAAPAPARQPSIDRRGIASAMAASKEPWYVSVSLDQAIAVQKYFPAGSAGREAIGAVIASDKDNFAWLSPGDVAAMAKEWAITMDERRITKMPSAQAPEVALVDSFLDDAVRGLKVKVPPPEEPFGARVNRLQDDPPTEAAAGAGYSPDFKKLGEQVKEPSKLTYDYWVEQQADVITKNVPGETFGYEARRVMADRNELRGRATEKWSVAERALKTKEGRPLIDKRVALEGAPEGQVPAWLPIADGRVAPQNAAERAVAEGFQAGNLELWNEARRTGEVRLEQTPDGPQYQQLPERDTGTTQRTAGEDSAKVMATEALRLAYFDTLVRANPDFMVPNKDVQTGKTEGTRRGTADDLEAEYKQKLQSKEFDSQDLEAATEFTRRFKNVPYDWKGPDGIVYRIFNSDPFQTFGKLVDRQSSRIASVRQYGQDVPEPARRAMLEQPDLAPEVRANLERGGLTKRIERVNERISQLPDLARREELLGVTKNLASRLQGVEPVQRNAMAQYMRPLTTVMSAMRSSKGFILDIPEPVFRNPIYGGFRRSMRAISDVAANPVEAIQWAQRHGYIEREIGEWVFDEAKGIPAKVASAVGLPGSLTERVKGAIAAKLAKRVIDDAKAGRATTNDLQVAQDILKLSPEDVAAIQRGDISRALEQQWMTELVGLLTSRVRPVAGSAAAASPNVSALLSFVKWFTKRTSDTVRTVASVKRAAERHGWKSRQTGRAMVRLVGLATGMTIGGTAGVALGKMFTGMVTGDPIDEGLGKFWNELTYAPATMLFKEGLKSQVIGGPLSQAWNIAEDSDKGRSWAQLTNPSSLAYSTIEAVKRLTKGDSNGFWQTVTGSGFVPFPAEVRKLWTMVASSQAATQAAFDAGAVREWKRAEDITTPFGSRNKPQAFYNTIGKVLEAARDNQGAPDEVLKVAAADLRKLLELAPEESVAGAIEGHQMTKSLTNEQRLKLAKWVNDSDRMARIYQHDAALRELGKMVRRMEGVSPTEWQAELDSVKMQASAGAGDRWESLTNRTLDDAAQRILSDEDTGSYLDDLAEAMAMHPDQLESAIGTKLAKRIQDPNLDSLTIARRIASALKSRARERAQAQRKEQRREQSDG